MHHSMLLLMTPDFKRVISKASVELSSAHVSWGLHFVQSLSPPSSRQTICHVQASIGDHLASPMASPPAPPTLRLTLEA